MDEKEVRTKKLQEYKERAERAIREEKIFRVISAYDVPRVKYELVKRGYVESISHAWNDEYARLSDYVLLEEAQAGNIFEQTLLSRLIGGNSAKYIWVTASQLYDTYKNVPYLSKINIKYPNFGNKDGLCEYVQMINSNVLDKSMGDICHPRSYCITDEKSIYEFLRDYRATLATALIFYLNENRLSEEWLSMENGTLDLKILDYAMDLIVKHIKWIKKEVDICEDDIYLNKNIEEVRWKELCSVHLAVIKFGQSFKPALNAELNENYIFRLKYLYELISNALPSRKYDGYRNVWLLKPTNSSQGQGIIVTDNEKCIISHLSQPKKKFVVQKYIERPFLIYDTKMDIRSYFLVTIDDKSIKFWTHPVSSIKFASSEFTLDNLTESIHITNAYVQQKYHTMPKDNPIPYHRMWSNDDFISYLESVNAGYIWHERIYPSMKRHLTAISKAVCGNIEKKPGRFELFGCDWIVTEDFNVFLLEIQRPPGMGYYSPVSIVVCGGILEDTIRVTVDRVRDPNASIGRYELIYEESIEPIFQSNIQGLDLPCKDVTINIKYNDDHNNDDDDDEEKTTKVINDETLFKQAIQTYNDKIIEVGCKSWV